MIWFTPNVTAWSNDSWAGGSQNKVRQKLPQASSIAQEHPPEIAQPIHTKKAAHRGGLSLGGTSVAAYSKS